METGAVVPGAGVVVYTGKCRVRPAATWGREARVAATEVSASTFQVSVPFSVTGVQRGMSVEIEASPDPALLGRVFEVRFIPDMGDHLTARRLLCEEFT